MPVTSREIIRRIVTFDAPPRIGWDFLSPGPSDFAGVDAYRAENPMAGAFSEWGRYPDLLANFPDFAGEVRLDTMGNIYGRLEGRTKGECMLGALQKGWGLLDAYQMPSLVPLAPGLCPDRFRIASLPVSPFSTMRDLRRLDHLLMDLLLEPERVEQLLGMILDLIDEAILLAADAGADAIFLCDDWGNQRSTLISPELWRKIFQPAYARVAQSAHRKGLFAFMHSCGHIHAIIGELIDAGMDALQLDQPDLMDTDRLGREFGGRVTFWSPVDIQKVMPTADRKAIQAEARRMLRAFNRGGGLIAKDYPSWQDIGVEREWAKWAMDVFVEEGLNG